MSLEASRLCNCVVDAASALMLYVLEACHAAAASLEEDCLKTVRGHN